MRFIFAIFVFIIPLSSVAQSTDAERCMTAPDPGVRLRYCSLLIQSQSQSKTLSSSGLAAVFTGRGIAFMDRREFDLALKDFDEALRLDPNNAIALAHRGEAHRSKKQYDAAIQDLDRAIQLDPKRAAAFYDRGVTHLERAVRSRRRGPGEVHTA